MRYTAPKGVFDILPSSHSYWLLSANWQFLEKILVECATEYGFKEIRTPIFESTELFIRSAGESSDIVNKEMYTFTDKGDRSITLRPEGTASVMRAYVENKLYAQGETNKYFYIGPMFRYERPQTGRSRQFHQFGAESIGCALPEHDAEIIDLALQIYKRLGLKNLKVLINSVGNARSRENYREALRDFLTPKYDLLSADSKVRFEKNMLRILDSKDSSDQALLTGSPCILDFLDVESKSHFDQLKDILKALHIDFEINTKMVRGLDYYNKNVFEITTDSLGAQNTIGAGGRYDGLVKEFGGPDKAAVGFATGIERILLAMQAQNVLSDQTPRPFVYLIALGENAKHFCFNLLSELRHQGVFAEMQLPLKKLQASLSRASELNASYCLLLGDDELSQGLIQIKDLKNRLDNKIKIQDALDIILKLKNEITLEKTYQTIFSGKS